MEVHRLIVPGRLPGLNEYSAAERANAKMAAAMKRQAEAKVILCAKRQLRGVQYTRPVRMEYLWVEENRRRDKDNIAFAKKFVQDGLVKAGVLADDGWKEVAGFTDDFAVDKRRPRVEIALREAEERT